MITSKNPNNINILNKIDKDTILLLDNLPVGIIRLNKKKECIFANKFVLSLLGIDNYEDVSKTQYASTHHEDIDRETNLSKKLFEENIESENVLRIYDNDLREYRWFIIKRTIINNNNNEVIFMYTLQDIHDNKIMEINLRNETLKSEKAYNHKSIFLANMSHEIRTPLNGIIGMLTLLEDTILTNEQEDYISMIKECSFNLMTIINDILDYSKLEVGKITLDIKSNNLRYCIESTNDIILSKIYEKSLEYSFNIDSHLPNCIKTDSNRLKQILLNLLSNSIKFTENGQIHLNIEKISKQEYNSFKHKHIITDSNENLTSNENLSYQDDDSDTDIDIKLNENKEYSNSDITDEYYDVDSTLYNYNNDDKVYARFNVYDTGCGIDMKDKPKLFKSFSQLDNRLTSKIYQGTGLGLAIAKELVELMNGCIWLDWSELDKGTRFSFVLEFHKGDGDSDCSEVIENDNILKDKTVLIVDDNLHNRISLSGIISKWGMKPYAFSNSEEALYFSKLLNFDIGLIDVCMPKVNGIEFANKLREQKNSNNHKIPLIALSSIGDKYNKSSKKNFYSHLLKPIKESRLKKICIDALRIHKKPIHNISEKIVNENTLDSYISDNNISELKENIRILVAEDIYINQKVIVSFLNKMGFSKISVVDNGQQCIDTIYQNDFDIILLDIRMPLLDGEIVLKLTKEYYEKINKRLPYIVAVTAYCLKEDKQKYISLGFDDYIPKPISINDLSQCMNKFVNKMLHD